MKSIARHVPSRSWPVVIILVFTGVPDSAQAQRADTLDYEAARRLAWDRNLQLRAHVDAIMEDPLGAFPPDLLEELATHFRDGVGNDRADKTACRPYVLLLYEVMFAVDRNSRDNEDNRKISNEQRLRTRLDDEGVKLFRSQLVDLLDHGQDYLSPPEVTPEVNAEVVVKTDNKGETQEVERVELLAVIVARQKRILTRFAGWILVSEASVEDAGQRELLGRIPDILKKYHDESDDIRKTSELAGRRIECGCIECECMNVLQAGAAQVSNTPVTSTD